MADFNVNVNTYLLVTQASHGFAVGQALRRVFGGSSYAVALADTIARARVSGVVAEVVDANSFRLALPGHRIAGLSGLTDGSTYFLSDSVSGGLTDIPPVIKSPVLVATSATTGIVIDCGIEAGFVRDGDVLATGLTFPDSGFKLTEEGGGSNVVTVRIDEVLSDDRVLNITLNDTDRILSLIGDAELSGTNTGDQDLSPYQTIAGLAADVRAVVLTGLSLASSAAVAATDTILEAFGKLQAFNNLFTTVGLAIARLANPSAIRFLRINADNTVTARTGSEMLTDLGVIRAGTTSSYATSSTSFSNVTGCQVTLAANTLYQVKIHYKFQSANANSGPNVAVSATNSPNIGLLLAQQGSTTSIGHNRTITANDNIGGTITTITDVSTELMGVIRGCVETGVSSSVLDLRLARGGASASNVTILKATMVFTPI